MKYYIDFTKISMEDYKDLLKASNLIPSHRILKEDIDNKFECLKQNGISNLDDLQKALKNKQKIEALVKATGLPEDYLVILNRAVSSLHPSPKSIGDFPGVSETLKEMLENAGIKNSVQLFEMFANSKGLPALLKDVSKPEESGVLFNIASLCRLRYVSPVFATLLIAAGSDTLEKIAGEDADALYERIKQLNMNNAFFNGKIGLSDVKFLISDAKYFIDKLE